MASHDGQNVEAVERSIEILDTLRRGDGSRITDLAETTEMSKATVYRHLQTLNNYGYVVEQDDIYHLSFQFLDFASSAYERESGYKIVEPKVKELAEETEELVQFAIEEHNRALFIYREAGEKAVQIAPNQGQPLYLHALAGGKAILAEWSDEALEEFIDTNSLSSFTSNTITDHEEFLKEIKRIRDAGYALNDQESTNALRAVAVPINKPNGDVLGALTISAPTNRMQEPRFHDEIPTLLKGVANEIELNFTVI